MTIVRLVFENNPLGPEAYRINISGQHPHVCQGPNFGPVIYGVSITDTVHDGVRYAGWVLRSFRDRDTERVWQRQIVRRFGHDVQRVAQRKLAMLDAAESLDDLRVPPGNRLEKLQGSRRGSYSVRINNQWRICFHWTSAGPEEVEIVDYH